MREEAPAITNWMADFAKHLAKHKGAALIIDYGYANADKPDTVQAMKNHAYVSPLETPGECDITAHVDFGALARAAETEKLISYPLLTQREFLTGLGIELRLAKLKTNATPEQAKDLESGAARLTGLDAMGELFKVLCVTHPACKTPEPFK